MAGSGPKPNSSTRSPGVFLSSDPVRRMVFQIKAPGFYNDATSYKGSIYEGASFFVVFSLYAGGFYNL